MSEVYNYITYEKPDHVLVFRFQVIPCNVQGLLQDLCIGTTTCELGDHMIPGITSGWVGHGQGKCPLLTKYLFIWRTCIFKNGVWKLFRAYGDIIIFRDAAIICWFTNRMHCFFVNFIAIPNSNFYLYVCDCIIITKKLNLMPYVYGCMHVQC